MDGIPAGVALFGQVRGGEPSDSRGGCRLAQVSQRGGARDAEVRARQETEQPEEPSGGRVKQPVRKIEGAADRAAR